MFGRKKTAQAAPEVDEPVRPGAKNRPTPSRRQQEASRRKPMVTLDRKAAAMEARQHAREQRDRQRTAMLTGDEKAMGPRDAGPVRRFVRDVVDSRTNLGDFYLLIVVLILVMSLSPGLLGLQVQTAAKVQVALTAVMWGTFVLIGFDLWLLARKLRAALKDRFGADFPTKGHVSYGVMRCLQLRRWRLPRPMIRRGETPRPSRS